ncbi:MAG: flagellar associated protein [Monoraphidium minutum]|nr:MAG: flagellar associated protein [Monoraphidium minutum]
MGNICYTCPRQETVAVVEAFGKFERIAESGCNCLNPCFGQSVAGLLSLRVQQLDVTCETKTRDNVFVTLVVSVQYQVNDPKAAFYKLTNSHSQISSYVFDVVRSSVPKLSLDDVFLEKEAIASSIREELTKSMSSFGFNILQALVNDIEPAKKVKEAMNDINASQRLRVAALEKAEASKVRVVKEAEAEAEAKYLHGAGVARQRQAIVAGLREGVREFSNSIPGIQSRDVLELMLVTQYFDLLRDVGSSDKCTCVFTSSADGGGGAAAGGGTDGLVAGLRKAIMEGQAMAR